MTKASSNSYPKVCLIEDKLDRLLRENEMIINSSQAIFKKVFESFTIHEKVLFLCDRDGYIINIVGDIDIVQWFFENGFKLGTSMSYESCGLNAVVTAVESRKISVFNTQQHHCEALKEWICLAAPIQIEEELAGIAAISLKFSEKISERINYCKIIIGLISDFIATLLKQGYKIPRNKLIFFGALTLNNRFSLTPREIEVLYRLKLGEPISKLPAKMSLSPNTIKSHIRNIYSKMDVKNLKECLQITDKILENT
ncbi:helix-turn-helix transcriptional regulator [Lucifera butyrica]|uniref:helix-turn-helix transcriptional regulator n=1 Tax=Lucifera butyrica TaxID=1351585 RepID=UPI001403C1F7|nr:helix-turn-helix transcriptional regulator [Lucifera butyrica]